jgi:hypothetical protein
LINLPRLFGDQRFEFSVLVEEVWCGVDHARKTTSLLPLA